jgi:hypothetical protein
MLGKLGIVLYRIATTSTSFIAAIHYHPYDIKDANDSGFYDRHPTNSTGTAWQRFLNVT